MKNCFKDAVLMFDMKICFFGSFYTNNVYIEEIQLKHILYFLDQLGREVG